MADFRSDTVTKPTEEMRRAMAQSVVGDDVLGDDPTVMELESLAAELLGMESALFVPSGTMGNAIAVKVWTQALDEVIVESRSHIYNMESTHMTFISRVNPRPLPSTRGAMDLDEVKRNIRIASVHHPRTSLICVENTHNNWGGAVVPLSNLEALRELANQYGLKVHMDGARLFNASTASGVPVRKYAECADSVMFCLSKGLCSPIGSMLAGPEDFIEMGRRFRKALGGGMRQVGVLAAAGLISLTKMVDRLVDDHRRARRLADEICRFDAIELDAETVETDIIIFGFHHPELKVQDFLSAMKERGVLALQVPQGIRMVVSREVDDEDVNRAVNVFSEILEN